MNSATETIERRGLRDYFYRANYAVLKDSNIFKLSNDMKGEFDDLCIAYADKFPIAGEHRYECRLNDEDGPIVESEVIPVSLLYSMPDEWQDRFCLVLDALNDIESDDDQYHVALLHPEKQRTCDDPFGDRWQIRETETNAGGPFYPYGTIEAISIDQTQQEKSPCQMT